MKPQTKKMSRKGYVVGRAGFIKISAVEGIQMSAAMASRAADSLAKGMTSEEARNEIVESYRRKD